MGKNNIEKYSAGYALIKAVAGFWHNKFFYRKIIIIGQENINPEHHLIFAPNHQNALMDALAVLFTNKSQNVFLARADIFKKKSIASILYFLKLLPVYRIRDGYSSLKGNDEIFAKTIDVIKNKNGLVILPEGNHEGFRRLRQLKKGICRVAFQSDEAENNSLKIKIIPVGLEYSHYIRYRQVLTVVYGKPIEVSEYHELYKTSPERALVELKNRLSDEIKNLMIHIESEEDYEAIDELRSIINGKYSDDIKYPKIFRDRILIEKLKNLRESDNQLYRKICTLSLAVKEKTAETGIDYRHLEKRRNPLGWLLAGMLVILIGLPVFLFGNIFNAIFMGLPIWQTRNIKDPQFVSSLRYGFSVALAIIFLPLFLILSLFLFSTWWIGLIFFISLPLTGLIAWNYYLLYRRILGGFKIRKYSSGKNKEYQKLKDAHIELINLVENIQNDSK
ncbi:MAG TPA: 1-acyl-sn-glycerol-3-phosphate acyltransferase [Bacteroidales bacterium]|nr:1-acyl-sn-glycerol-3-phosphate acyltransferase [Bacteroidales bacterium]